MVGLGLGLGLQKGAAAGGGGGDTANPIAEVYADYSLVNADSYPGTGIDVASLEGTPPDLFFGNGATSTTYPTFNGTAGDSGAYLSFDGSDRLTLDGTPTFVGDLGNNSFSNDATIVWAFRHVYDGNKYIFGVGGFTDTSAMTIRDSGGNGSLSFFNRASSSNQFGTIAGAGTLGNGVDTVLILSLNFNTGTGKYWSNTGTGSSFTPPAGYPATATGVVNVMGAAGTQNASAGSRLYGFSLYSKFFTDDDAAAINAMYNARHGSIFTIS